jgi:hypothetical protein
MVSIAYAWLGWGMRGRKGAPRRRSCGAELRRCAPAPVGGGDPGFGGRAIRILRRGGTRGRDGLASDNRPLIGRKHVMDWGRETPVPREKKRGSMD